MSNKERLGKNPLFRDALEEQSKNIPVVPEISTPGTDSKQSLPGNPTKPGKPNKLTSSAGLPSGWTRATFIVEIVTLQKIKDYAYWERQDIKEVVKDIFDKFFKGCDVKPQPPKY
jgi:hypothetical protein